MGAPFSPTKWLTVPPLDRRNQRGRPLRRPSISMISSDFMRHRFVHERRTTGHGALFSDRRTAEGPPTKAASLVPNALAAPFAFEKTNCLSLLRIEKLMAKLKGGSTRRAMQKPVSISLPFMYVIHAPFSAPTEAKRRSGLLFLTHTKNIAREFISVVATPANLPNRQFGMRYQQPALF